MFKIKIADIDPLIEGRLFPEIRDIAILIERSQSKLALERIKRNGCFCVMREVELL